MSILTAALAGLALGVLVYVATMLERLVAINREVVREMRAERADASTSIVPSAQVGDFFDESTRPIGAHNRPTPAPLPPVDEERQRS